MFISFPGSFSFIWNKAKAQCYYQMLLFIWNCFIIKYDKNNLHNLPRSFCPSFTFLICYLAISLMKQKTKFNKNKTSDLILKRLGICQVKKVFVYKPPSKSFRWKPEDKVRCVLSLCHVLALHKVKDCYKAVLILI